MTLSHSGASVWITQVGRLHVRLEVRSRQQLLMRGKHWEEPKVLFSWWPFGIGGTAVGSRSVYLQHNMEMTEERNQREDACNRDGKRVNCIIIGCIFFFFFTDAFVFIKSLKGGQANRVLECLQISCSRCPWCQCFWLPPSSDRLVISTSRCCRFGVGPLSGIDTDTPVWCHWEERGELKILGRRPPVALHYLCSSSRINCVV